ncbi:hypothetical protein JGI1_01210 [Candidatus Thermokryptus mobilis]|uniref:Uncharacterized protein n=1 Tax=Candidatus Thermokryptus mobilis TaxID=1643428 RepID=A0A0S4N1W9_9BACT|nr:hypothetical protein [Candidatus Thermokryptus mobilis]CUU05268.1 hypothetical protein JGI1_01210 [Candidatus Thermokryptus mobilis]
MRNVINFLLFVILPIALIVALLVLISKISSPEREEELFDESGLFI